MVDIHEDKTRAPKETQYFNFGQNIQIKNFDEAIKAHAEVIYNDKLKDLSGTVATNVPNQYKAKFIFKPSSNAGRLVLNDKIIPVIINHLKKFQYPDFSNPQTKKKCLEANAFVAPYRLIFQILVYMTQIIEEQAFLTYDEVFQYVYLLSLKEDLSHPNVASIVNRILEGRKNGVFYDAHKELYHNYWNQPWRQYHEEIVEIMVLSGLITRDEDYTIQLKKSLSSQQKRYLTEIILFNNFLMNEVNEEEYAKYFDITDEDTNRYMEENTMRKINPFTPLQYTPIGKKIGALNRIVFGAPGTGKSFQLQYESKENKPDSPFDNIERVTFYPDYSYGQFVGSYKPVSDDDGRIRYEYVPGPFMRTLVSALKSGKTADPKKYLLIVEEINRAKVAAVFGDMFQLLDRTDEGDSVYGIQASEDVRRYLADALDSGTKDDYKSIKLPNNMYIWATMNSADQGVFPMDTAFKRRWEFTYLGIDKNKDKITIKDLPIINGENKTIEWNTFRRSINDMLLRVCKVNEDKLLGPFFISGDVFINATKGKDDNEKRNNQDAFFDAFNSKVLMYLFEDAGKMHQKKLFEGINQDELTFSKVCEEFKKEGIKIFGSAFQLVKE